MDLFKRMSRMLFRSQRRHAEARETVIADAQMLSSDFPHNVKVLEDLFAECADLVFHRFQAFHSFHAVLVYFEGMSNKELTNEHIMAPLLRPQEKPEESVRTAVLNAISSSQVKELVTYAHTIEELLVGNPVLLVQGNPYAVSIGLADVKKRAIDEPVAESVVRGPREGFTEALSVNTTLIRKTIKSPALKMKSVKIGRYTQTQTMIAFMDGIADPALIEEVEKRLRRIDIDGVLESSYIEELVEDNPYSVFPQLISTERPDVVVANLLEGRAAILVDGTPFALVAPVTIFSLLQSPEDYYERFWSGSVIRWLRYLFFMIALIIPSAYVAILTYHQEMIPTSLLLSVAKSREEIPFPALVEALVMEVTFEALREAGVRLPKQVGAAVSIVGALVIGQAAISAGLVSAPMVMVVAITGIASFTIPRYALGISVRILRFPLMFLAGMLGLLGLMLGLITIFVHLSALRSFGVPYLSPMAPANPRIGRVFSKLPLWTRDARPEQLAPHNLYRQAPGLKPGPEQGNGS
ncbi:Spore germination protein A1 [Paenibacillus solanacearum]|uniref:Spore germination protein A1 n=1 Tax=Paenibacillus solanacearum TaxID=2048548 RepID=A0A916K844_9BACL|nr:spore germination protein [Paenibacillus solanacearum]CAG7644053.1 Spore germination protein A1 [Paenibacillus solanacearum]